MKYYTTADFPLSTIKNCDIERRSVGNQGTTARRVYKQMLTGFDIETTRIPAEDQSFMYVWQWYFEGVGVVIGRTWHELRLFIMQIEAVLDNAMLVVLVHNLSYEFQFLRAVHEWKTDEVFAVKSRRVLKATMNGKLEFRCTMLHSNMSLATWTAKMGVEHGKLSGEDFNYEIMRYPDTPLSETELAYITNDVVGMVEAYRAEMERDSDNLYKIPLTSTGYVRADSKRAMRNSGKVVKTILPDYDIYKILRKAFRGGNTHANRYYSGMILENVKSADRSSSYPDVICNCKFPMTKFREIVNPDIWKVEKMMKDRRALVFTILLHDVELSDPYNGFPYISVAKCAACVRSGNDNGRVLNADFIEMTVTDIDWRIIKKQYEFSDVQVTKAYWSHYGYLPRALIVNTIDYYTKKTSLKGVDGQQLLYDKSKNLLNGIYGMMAQDPVKQDIIYHEGTGEFTEDDAPPESLLAEFSKHAFLAYQWGVWITAWARLRLQEGIDLCGHNCVYVDTDSCKYLGEVDWTAYNRKRIRASAQSGAYATDPHGKRHYMGVFEDEEPYTKFKTLGAKKYVFEHADGKLQVTIAGVNKKKGGAELFRRGGIEAFREGFTFIDAGGTESVYNDSTPYAERILNGHKIEMSPNICIRPSTYTVSLTDEYRNLLETCKVSVDNF
jgi:hypothetical protein